MSHVQGVYSHIQTVNGNSVIRKNPVSLSILPEVVIYFRAT